MRRRQAVRTPRRLDRTNVRAVAHILPSVPTTRGHIRSGVGTRHRWRRLLDRRNGPAKAGLLLLHRKLVLCGIITLLLGWCGRAGTDLQRLAPVRILVVAGRCRGRRLDRALVPEVADGRTGRALLHFGRFDARWGGAGGEIDVLL